MMMQIEPFQLSRHGYGVMQYATGDRLVLVSLDLSTEVTLVLGSMTNDTDLDILLAKMSNTVVNGLMEKCKELHSCQSKSHFAIYAYLV